MLGGCCVTGAVADGVADGVGSAVVDLDVAAVVVRVDDAGEADKDVRVGGAVVVVVVVVGVAVVGVEVVGDVGEVGAGVRLGGTVGQHIPFNPSSSEAVFARKSCTLSAPTSATSVGVPVSLCASVTMNSGRYK